MGIKIKKEKKKDENISVQHLVLHESGNRE